MKGFLLGLNSILIGIVVLFILLFLVGFFLGDEESYGVLVSFLCVVTIGVLTPLFIWRRKLDKSTPPNSNTPSTIQKEVTQKDTSKSSVKEEKIEPEESGESISQSPKPSEPPMGESISQDKEKVLSDFIELCILGGELTDKKKEVVFRKSKELGIPEDECQITLDSILFKMKNQ